MTVEQWVTELFSDAAFFAEGTAAGVYTVRDEQIAMARFLAERRELGQISLVEAGTGTGKSYAYLAAALLSRNDRNSPILLSTATINLQNQLLNRDIPRITHVATQYARSRGLTERLTQTPTAVVLLGRSNFVSVRRARFALDQDGWSLSESQELAAVARWLDSDTEGLLSELDLSDAVRDAVESQTDNCLGQRCPTHAQCFYFRRRRAVMQADIVVVNHALLCTDMRMREIRTDARGVLPDYGLVIIDEAHNLAATAIEHFGQVFSSHALAVALQKLHRPKGKKAGGALPRFEHADLLLQMILNPQGMDDLRQLHGSLMSSIALANEELLRWNLAVTQMLPGRERQRLTEDSTTMEALREASNELRHVLGVLAGDLEQYTALVEPLINLPDHPLRDAHVELLSATRRIQAHT